LQFRSLYNVRTSALAGLIDPLSSQNAHKKSTKA
jgi:hypothetical protein